MKKPHFLKNVVLASTLVSVASFASLSSANHSSLNGWYAGFNAGTDLMQISNNTSASSTVTILDDFINLPLPNAVSINSNNQYYPYTFLGLQAGYRFPMNGRYAFAFEAFGQINRGSAESNQSAEANLNPLVNFSYRLTVNNQTKLKYFYGLRLEPGVYLANNTLLYGIAGVGVARFTSQLNSDINGYYRADSTYLPITAGFANSSSFNRMAPQVGIGLEQAVSQRFSVGAHYLFSYFGKAYNSGSATTPILLGDDPFYYHLDAFSQKKLVLNELALSINYHF